MTCSTITNVALVILAIAIVLNLITMLQFWKSERAFKRSLRRLEELRQAVNKQNQ